MTTDTSSIVPAGTPAPVVPLSSSEQPDVQLAALYTQRPLLLAFFGDMANPFTHDNAAQLRDGHEAVLRAGAGLAAIAAVDPARAEAFEDRWMLPYPVLSDVAGGAARAFGVAGAASVVIDTNGVITFARAAANLADYPPMAVLLNAVCDVTGAERPRSDDDDPVTYDGTAPPAIFDGALDPSFRAFTCVKCGGASAQYKDISTTGGAISKFFDVQGHRFIAASCVQCGYTELYRRKTSGMSKAVDVLGALG